MDLLGANLRSLQALVEFQNALPMLSNAVSDEIQEMILSANLIVQDAEQTLSKCRDDLWEAENRLQNTEKSDYEEYTHLEEARTAVARADVHLSEVQAAYISFQSIASTLNDRLTGHFANAQSFLEERIQAAKLYQALSISDTVGISTDNGPAQARRFTPTPPTGALRSDDDVVASPLRGASKSALPILSNGMEWVAIDEIEWDGVDGVPDDLEFRKVSKENMKEMLETFENELLPVLSENKDISDDELQTIDKKNASEGSSNSLRLCHDSMIGSSNTSDVIVLQTKPLSTAGKDHPAAGTPAFESGREACTKGMDCNSNPYRHLVGREGAANIWDQGWQWQSNERQLGFTSGRHRVLVAQELGWQFIPARVLGDRQDEK